MERGGGCPAKAILLEGGTGETEGLGTLVR